MKETFAWEKVWIRGRYSTESARKLKAQRKFEAFIKMGVIPDNLGKIVEIGCGNAAFFKLAIENKKQFKSYLGVDRSPSALVRANENLKNIANCTLANESANNIPIASESADTIIALGVLEHIENIAECVEELRRIAIPGARLLISTSNTKSAMYAARKVREFVGAWPYGYQKNHSESILKEILNPGFEVKSLATLHGNNDYPISTAIDRTISMIDPSWGRYIVCEAIAK